MNLNLLSQDRKLILKGCSSRFQHKISYQLYLYETVEIIFLLKLYFFIQQTTFAFMAPAPTTVIQVMLFVEIQTCQKVPSLHSSLLKKQLPEKHGGIHGNGPTVNTERPTGKLTTIFVKRSNSVRHITKADGFLISQICIFLIFFKVKYIFTVFVSLQDELKRLQICCTFCSEDLFRGNDKSLIHYFTFLQQKFKSCII